MKALQVWTLFFLFRTQKLRDPSGEFLFESKILVMDAVNGVDRHPMGSSKRFYILATMNLNSGDDRSDEPGSPDSFLRIEIALAVYVFSGLNFLQDGINCSLLQDLVSLDSVPPFFISKKSSPALSMSATKSYTRNMLSGLRGGSD
jgi:hypothetical protein